MTSFGGLLFGMNERSPNREYYSQDFAKIVLQPLPSIRLQSQLVKALQQYRFRYVDVLHPVEFAPLGSPSRASFLPRRSPTVHLVHNKSQSVLLMDIREKWHKFHGLVTSFKDLKMVLNTLQTKVVSSSRKLCTEHTMGKPFPRVSKILYNGAIEVLERFCEYRLPSDVAFLLRTEINRQFSSLFLIPGWCAITLHLSSWNTMKLQTYGVQCTLWKSSTDMTSIFGRLIDNSSFSSRSSHRRLWISGDCEQNKLWLRTSHDVLLG